MIKRLLNAYIERRIKRACDEKWSKILAANKKIQINKEISQTYNSYWQDLGEKIKEYFLTGYIAISKVEDSRYVPEDIYYTRIEPTLNSRTYASAYADKNFYQRFLSAHVDLFPFAYLRCINGVLTNNNYNAINTNNTIDKLFAEGKEYIFKPSVETSGGAGVVLLRYEKGLFYLDNNAGIKGSDFLAQIKNKYKNFIIQEKIAQHKWFSDFNESSLNTIRVFAYRSVKDESVHVLSSVIRFGKPGSIVDNQAAGGLTCGVSNDGKANDFTCTKTGRTNDVPKEILVKGGQNVPEYNKLIELAKKIAPAYGYHRLLGFDFCVTSNNEVKLLEINCKNIEINFLQMNNGPLFGEFTSEIVEYCKSNKKSITLDFSI